MVTDYKVELYIIRNPVPPEAMQPMPDANLAARAPSPPAPLPPEVRWLFGFQFANAVNFTLALGAPMVLTARFLGAGESLLGCLLSFTPFLVILQLFASNLAERWGYRRLMLAGWGTRACLLLLAAPLPLLHGRVPDALLLGALTAVLFGFNLVRGFSSGAWLPWISQRISEPLRGRYFGWEQSVVSFSVLLALFTAGAFVGKAAAGWKYAVLLLVSWLAGWLSIAILRRVPCQMPPAAEQRARRDWRQLLHAYRSVWAEKSFRRVCRFSVMNSLAIAAFPGFLLLFQRDRLALGEGVVLMLASGSTFGVLLTALFWGRFTDRFGSRPTLRLAGAGQFFVLIAWMLTAAGLHHPGLVEVALLCVLFGVVQCASSIPQLKLFLAACPAQEITVAVTLNGVLVAVSGGMAPVVWGVLLQILRAHGAPSGLLQAFSIFFAAAALLTLAAQVILSRIREPRAVPTLEVMVTLLRDWPLRVISDIGWFGSRPER